MPPGRVYVRGFTATSVTPPARWNCPCMLRAAAGRDPRAEHSLRFLVQAGGKSVKGIIPLAGKSTRLRPHTYSRPRPLLKVGGRPVMSYILDDLETLGVDEIIFVTGYLKETIEEYIRKEYPQFKAQFIEQAVQN